MRQWYRIEAKQQDDVADVYIYDEIGKSWFNDDAVTAASFVAELNALPENTKTIRVHINSPGGSVFEANAIANALRAQQADKGRTVEARIDGLAASAATIVSSAANPIKMADNALFMIHEPTGFALGTAEEMRSLANTLDSVRDTIIAAYRWVSKKSTEELSAMMKATTWMKPKDALANGFITEIVGAATVTALFRPQAVASLGDIPEEFKANVDALVEKPAAQPEPAAAADVLRLCKAGDCLDLAEGFLTAKATLADVEAGVAKTKTIRDAQKQRAKDVAAMCGHGKVTEFSAAFAASNLSLEDIGKVIGTITAARDKAEIDTGLHPDQIKANAEASWKKATDKVNRRYRK